MKKAALTLPLALIILCFSGCIDYFSLYAKNNICGFTDEHGTCIYYYDKVGFENYYPQILVGYDQATYKDSLLVKIAEYDDYLYLTGGYFEKYVYHKGLLLIYMDGEYYVFDVFNYHPEDYKDIEEVKDYILVLSEAELKEKYPDYQAYNWKRY